MNYMINNSNSIIAFSIGLLSYFALLNTIKENSNKYEQKTIGTSFIPKTNAKPNCLMQGTFDKNLDTPMITLVKLSEIQNTLPTAKYLEDSHFNSSELVRNKDMYKHSSSANYYEQIDQTPIFPQDVKYFVQIALMLVFGIIMIYLFIDTLLAQNESLMWCGTSLEIVNIEEEHVKVKSAIKKEAQRTLQTSTTCEDDLGNQVVNTALSLEITNCLSTYEGHRSIFLNSKESSSENNIYCPDTEQKHFILLLDELDDEPRSMNYLPPANKNSALSKMKNIGQLNFLEYNHFIRLMDDISFEDCMPNTKENNQYPDCYTENSFKGYKHSYLSTTLRVFRLFPFGNLNIPVLKQLWDLYKNADVMDESLELSYTFITLMRNSISPQLGNVFREMLLEDVEFLIAKLQDTKNVAFFKHQLFLIVDTMMAKNNCAVDKSRLDKVISGLVETGIRSQDELKYKICIGACCNILCAMDIPALTEDFEIIFPFNKCKSINEIISYMFIFKTLLLNCSSKNNVNFMNFHNLFYKYARTQTDISEKYYKNRSVREINLRVYNIFASFKSSLE